jgi:hypothetical protein
VAQGGPVSRAGAAAGPAPRKLGRGSRARAPWGRKEPARKAAGITVGSLHDQRHLALTALPPVPLHVVVGRLGDDPKTVLPTRACCRTPTRWPPMVSPPALV